MHEISFFSSVPHTLPFNFHTVLTGHGRKRNWLFLCVPPIFPLSLLYLFPFSEPISQCDLPSSANPLTLSIRTPWTPLSRLFLAAPSKEPTLEMSLQPRG